MVIINHNRRARQGVFLTFNRLSYMGVGMSTPTERRYRREARYSAQLRVTVEPATAAALEAEADAAGLSVSAVIRDAVARGLPLVKDARRKQRQRDRTPTRTGVKP